MRDRTTTVADTDIALLRTLGRVRSIVGASRAIGITRDRATYRIARMERAFGAPVVASVRGGRGHGTSRLTPLGGRIARGGFHSIELFGGPTPAELGPTNRLRGTYHRRPAPGVELAGGVRWRVAFRAAEGERVEVLVDPQSILIARARFPSSARNVLAAIVESVRGGGFARTLHARWGAVPLRVAVTDETVRSLRLAPGARVWLYLKATAVRRSVPTARRLTRGSLRR
ncbi:MAG TPA: TOBE domain-containing protein [Thermoplasmata archaeon]|nr:TOBE domain-containing protein [Thermoplasmata archaeon]